MVTRRWGIQIKSLSNCAFDKIFILVLKIVKKLGNSILGLRIVLDDQLQLMMSLLFNLIDTFKFSLKLVTMNHCRMKRSVLVVDIWIHGLTDSVVSRLDVCEPKFMSERVALTRKLKTLIKGFYFDGLVFVFKRVSEDWGVDFFFLDYCPDVIWVFVLERLLFERLIKILKLNNFWLIRLIVYHDIWRLFDSSNYKWSKKTVCIWWMSMRLRILSIRKRSIHVLTKVLPYRVVK